MLKRRTKKVTQAMVRRITDKQFLACRECGVEEVQVAGNVGAVVCGNCVQKMIAPPHNYSVNKVKSDKPRGWHFKALFEKDGVVYSKGVEVTDPDEIANLRKVHGKSVSSKSSKKTAPRKKKVTKGSVKKKVSRRSKTNARTS